jgi:NTE family protein
VSIPIFAIFEGGGAKGVAHVGAVAACERDFYFVGVAGASAGAIIASLLAVGFTAAELLDPEKVGENILARYGRTPVDLLGRPDWERMRGHEPHVVAVFEAKERWRKVWRARKALPVLTLLREKWPHKGVMSTDHVRAFLNEVLRDKLTEVRQSRGVTEPAPDRITFADLDYGRFEGELLPLKIIATNVSTRELWIFDRELTPDVEVAHAVAASIAIPAAFKPVEIEVDGQIHRFVDGGVVSNLPIWVFANEKIAFERANWRERPVPIVGFTLRDKTASADGVTVGTGGDGVLRHFYGVMQTALSGSQAVSQRFVQDLTVAPLSVGLDMLEFDASEEKLLDAYNDGFRCADQELRHALIERPALVREQLAKVHAVARAGIIRLMPKSERRRRWRLRASVVEKARDTNTYRVTFGHGMEIDADDRLSLDERGRGAPATYLMREPRLTPVGPDWADPDGDFMTKYERALVPTTVRWIISIPIFPHVEAWDAPPDERPEPCGVLSLDSSRSLETAFDDLDFMSLLTAQSTLLFPVLTREPKRG